MTEIINNFLPLKMDDPYTFAGDYEKDFYVISTCRSQQEQVFRIQCQRVGWFEDMLFDKIENLEALLNYVKQSYRNTEIIPIFEMMYAPFILNSTNSGKRKEKLVLFIRFVDKYFNIIKDEKDLFPEKSYNPCFEEDEDVYVSPKIASQFDTNISNSLKIDFDLFWEDELIKLFNYLYFRKTDKTCYEDMLENSYMEDWFEYEPKNICDINSMDDLRKSCVYELQRYHRQTLTKHLVTMMRFFS